MLVGFHGRTKGSISAVPGYHGPTEWIEEEGFDT